MVPLMNKKHSETIPPLACAPGSHNPHGGPVSRRSGPRAWTLRVLLALLVAAVAGLPVPLQPQETAAQVETTSKKQDKLLSQESGFLDGDDLSRLRPDPGNSDWLIYIKDPDALKKSDSFLVAPVKVYFPSDV